MKDNLIRKSKKFFSVVIALAMVIGMIAAPQTVIPTNAKSNSAEFEVGDLRYNILADGTVEVSRNLHKSQNIVIPKTVTVDGKTYTVSRIGRLAFDEQDAYYGNVVKKPIKSVEIPDTVTSIGDAAFEHCYYLTSITMPDSITFVDREAFVDSAISSVKLSKNLKSIEPQTFSCCKNLKDITLPEGITSIGEDAFADCTGLTSITLPESMSQVSEYAFAGCKNLTEIIVPMKAEVILHDDCVKSVSNYSIDSKHGKVSLSGVNTTKNLLEKNWFEYWDDITVTVTPDTGYKLESLVVIDNEKNTTIPIIDNKFSVSGTDITIKATYTRLGSNQNNGGSAGANNSGNGSSSGNGTNGSSAAYSSEWVKGKWYNADGSQTYEPTMSWKSDSTGWWIEDTSGWYPASQWQKIDGYWYYFSASGYMASGEYYNGYWFNSDGSWDEQYYLTWKSDSTGWWVEDKSGWWPVSQWLKIDGSWYYFNGSGYMVTSQYVDGYWIDANGVCK